MSSDDDEKDVEVPGRGMISITVDDEGVVEMLHIETAETFGFDRSDLDEVIGSLAIFRLMLEAHEQDGEDEDDGLSGDIEENGFGEKL